MDPSHYLPPSHHLPPASMNHIHMTVFDELGILRNLMNKYVFIPHPGVVVFDSEKNTFLENVDMYFMITDMTCKYVINDAQI